MAQDERAKPLLPGYVGIKYQAVCCGAGLTPACRTLYPQFRAQGQRLARYGMAPANGGNMSVRLADGFLLTASGSQLGDLDPEDIVWVHGCSIARQCTQYTGARLPSSEAMLHQWVLHQRWRSGCVVHAHDEVATSTALCGLIPETVREEPYGTIALARLAVATLSGERRIIVLRNHGYVAVGANLEQTIDLIVAMHERLLRRGGG